MLESEPISFSGWFNFGAEKWAHDRDQFPKERYPLHFAASLIQSCSYEGEANNAFREHRDGIKDCFLKDEFVVNMAIGECNLKDCYLNKFELEDFNVYVDSMEGLKYLPKLLKGFTFHGEGVHSIVVRVNVLNGIIGSLMMNRDHVKREVKELSADKAGLDYIEISLSYLGFLDHLAVSLLRKNA